MSSDKGAARQIQFKAGAIRLRKLFGVVSGMLAIGVLGLAATPAGAVVLGSPTYVPNGAGWGEAEPSVFSNGGVPSGQITGIKWKGWGAPAATGTGLASIYKPAGNYYPRLRVPLRVSNIGTCPGQADPAYLTLELRHLLWPGSPLGPWVKWSGSQDLCDYHVTDPAYADGEPPGYCGYTGDEYKESGHVINIQANQVACKKARSIASAPIRGSSHHKVSCWRSGCSQKVQGFHCRYYGVKSIDYVDSEGAPVSNPLQRVACKKGRASIAWFSVLFYD